jgi:enoyl-CoA hydratase
MVMERSAATSSGLLTRERPQSRETVVVEQLEGGVVLIGIDRREANNYIDPATFVALGQAYWAFEHDNAQRVAVLHAFGPDFVSGLDVAAFGVEAKAGRFPSKAQRSDYIDPLDMTQPRRSKPVVVAVQGATKYVGHELFLAADVRVAASDTVFSQGEASLGLFPAGGATVRLVREAGRSNAMRHMLTGEPWGAEEAYRYGMVQAITAPGKQLERAIEFARKMAAAAPLGVRATLASVRLGEEEGEAAAFAPARAELGRLLQTDDFKEFVASRSQQRQPVFQGR